MRDIKPTLTYMSGQADWVATAKSDPKEYIPIGNTRKFKRFLLGEVTRIYS